MKLLTETKKYLYQTVFLFKKSWFFRVVCLCLVILIGTIFLSQLFLSSQKLHFSFATNQSCINSFNILPNIQKFTSNFEVTNERNIKIFKYPILSKKICIKAKSVPQENKTAKASISVLGNSFIKRNIQIIVPEYPKANDVLTEKSYVSVAQPLQFKLNKADSIFNYELSADDIKTRCVKKELIYILCDTASLKLKHANIYKFSISRTFKGQKVSTIVETKIPTITALNITSTTIENNQTVFDKPKTIEITTDKPIQSLDGVVLSSTSDAKVDNVDIDTKFSGNKIFISIKNDIKRGLNFKLTIKDIISTDKGSLVKPFELSFYTSKGPTVSNVNIRDRSTAVDQSITINFDQNLQTNQDLAKYINITVNDQPRSLSISQTANRVILTPNSPLPKCTKFNVNVGPGLSSKYGIITDINWIFRSRTNCYSMQSIGISIRGRVIYAYRFGNGQNAVMYIANLHGNEANTKSLMDKWINELEGSPEKIPANRSIIVVPSINPDGLNSRSRFNANGIDLNRNFPANNWKQAITLPSGKFAANGGGSEALSEPESRAIATYISSVNPKLVMSYHSQGSVAVGNDSGQANSLASLYASKTGYAFKTNANIGNYFNYDTTGALEDWLHDKQNRPAILIELSNRYSDEFSRNRIGLWLMAQSL